MYTRKSLKSKLCHCHIITSIIPLTIVLPLTHSLHCCLTKFTEVILLEVTLFVLPTEVWMTEIDTGCGWPEMIDQINSQYHSLCCQKFVIFYTSLIYIHSTTIRDRMTFLLDRKIGSTRELVYWWLTTTCSFLLLVI